MQGIIVELIITLLGVLLVKCSPKTYDLLRYSHVNIIRTVSKPEERDCTEVGFNYECARLANSSEGFKEHIWKHADSWKAYFDEYTKEVKIEVSFNRVYIVNNILLSFKEAKNISAVSVEIYSDSKIVHTAYYALSDLLCGFFFPDDSSNSFCNIKEDLSEGVIIHHKEPVKGDRIIIHLFPPIVNSYDKKHFYSVNQLFIGGSCSCLRGHPLKCTVASEDDTGNNDGARYALVCAVDEKQIVQDNRKKKRRRREICICSPAGTLYGLCKPFVGITQQCPCKQNYAGISCDKCASGYFGYPKCNPCNCDYVGSISSSCNATTGQCKCEPRYSGLQCDKCAPGRFDFPFCYPCPCPKQRTKSSVCHPVSGKCLCLDRYQGEKCSSCKRWFENFPICHRPGCKCSKYGALDGTCTDGNRCKCKKRYTGKQCDTCASGYGNYPVCKACNCDPFGSHNGNCNPKTGQCPCKPSYVGTQCNECARSDLAYPHCNGRDKCICDVSGTRQAVRTEGPCVIGHSCLCKKNVNGIDCSSCNRNSYNLSAANPDGCSLCQCFKAGSFGNLATCNDNTGQCYCKPNVEGEKCDKCKEGFHLMNRWNLFGCTACNCDIGGSLSLTCDNRGGCKCKKNFEGMKCNKMREGPYYVANYYHIIFEVENATINNKPVIYRYHSAEFANFTGKGYFRFGQEQTDIKLELNVTKASNYRLLVRYFLKLEHETTMLVNLNSKDKETSYAAVVDFEAIDTEISAPNHAMTLKSDGGSEFFLTKGVWEMEMSSISSYLLLDHIVLIPEEYYTGNILEPNDIGPCIAGQESGSTCMMYQYLNLQTFQLLQAERGSDSKGYEKRTVKKTRLYKDSNFLQHLPVLGDMAELSRNQIALTLEVSVSTTDIYYLIVTYFNPDERTYRLDMYDGDSGKRGQIEVVPCLYLFLCRLIIHQTDGTPLSLKYSSNKTSQITFLGNIRGSLAIDYIALIPVSKWSPDYIIPSKLCDKKNGVCMQNLEFQTPEDVIKIDPSEANPVNSLTNTVYAVPEKPVFFVARGIKSDKYLLIYQFYQPNSPSFLMEVKLSLQGTLKPSEIVRVPNCPANSGCRNILLELNARNGVMDGPVTITIHIPKNKELWIDSMFLIAESSFSGEILEPKRVESKLRFRRSCVDQNGLPLLNPPEGFCMQSLITLTSQFTNRTFECNCNQRGSLSLQCDKIGGQCKCRSGVVGRDCSRCQTGFYNFPYCKPCNCFGPGSVSADCNRRGQCKCQPNYTGWSCNRCGKQRWGFPSCKPCDCEARGSFGLACRRSDGQCSCLKNFGGKQCKQCQVGYFDFPDCRSCNCNPAGIQITKNSPTGCFKFDRNRCDCKKNVEGNQCEVCKPFFYRLNVSNPLGCSPCNCSSFGTVRGAGPCNMITGQCLCQPNVVGKDCTVCKDGFYVVKTDHVFKCQPCLCSSGGSLDGVCDKLTGQCKCKPHISGTKCDRLASGGYYLPSISKYVFHGQQISPSSPRGVIQGLDGAYVNSSFASARMDFEVTKTQLYYLLISYALVEKKNAVIDLEFSNDVSFTYLTHKLKSKKLNKPMGEVVKEDSIYLKLNFTKGSWSMQALFQETIFLSQITLVPCEYFKPYSVSRRIRNPCTIKDNRRFCAMYTYYDVSKTSGFLFEAESLTRRNVEYFNLTEYKGADINGAIALHQNEYLFTKKMISIAENYYVIIQYLNLEKEMVGLEVSIRNNGSFTVQKGVGKLYPCTYAFGCRQVVLDINGRKASYQQTNGDALITFKVISGKAAFIDFISLVPASKWTSHIITPEFYCTHRFARCIPVSFPTAPNMLVLETKSARGVSLMNSAPPKSLPPSVSVLLSTYQRNLRWMSPMKAGGYYLIVHYYQPLGETFYSKIILTTFQRAVAGKIQFKYCPSIYGCRASALYLEEDLIQRFLLSGNILRATFTFPFGAQVWVESLLFVNPREYALHRNFLETNPLDLTRKYLRKCAGKQYKQISKNIKSFCRPATFEMKLRSGINPNPCKCHPLGTVVSTQCNSYDGHCICKKGFLGRDCSLCVEGKFPSCKSRNAKT